MASISPPPQIARRPEWQRARVELVSLCVLLFVYLSWLAFHWIPVGSEGNEILVFPLIDALVIFAAWRAAQRSRSFPALRSFWLLIALAWASELIGDVIQAIYIVGPSSPPFPSQADPFYIAFYPLLLLALLRVPTVHGTRSQRLRVLLDSATIVVGGGAAIWYFLLGPAVTAGGEGFLAGVVSIAYPLGDLVVLVALAAILMRRSPMALRASLNLIAVGLLVLIAADVIYGAGLLHATQASGGAVGILYFLVAVPFVLAAASQREMRAGDPSGVAEGSAEPDSRVGWLPLLAMAVGFGTLLGTRIDAPFFPDLSLLLFALALASLVATRRYVAQHELRRTAAALGESERRFRGIFDNAAVGITYTDLEGPTIIDANNTFAKMVGSTPKQLRGSDYSRFIQPEQRGADRALAEAIQGGEVDHMQQELPYVSADGTTRWAMLSLSTLRDESGAPRHVIGIFEDVTRRREAERVKDEFVSVAGHELRTPLTSIRGSLGLLNGGVMGELPPEATEMLGTAISNTDRLVRLVNDILDIERIDSGKAEIELAPVPVAELVEQSLQVVGGVAEAADVELRSEVDDTVVECDADKIVETLTNLLGNAIKFSGAGSAVAVSAARAGEEVVFAVRDAGRGIPPDQLESIFERFSQVDVSDAREKGGSGLGLAIARGIVESHGGRIWADSAEGEGTTFSFTLPLGKETDGTTPTAGG